MLGESRTLAEAAAPYRVIRVDETTSTFGESWTVRFMRHPEPDVVVDLTMNTPSMRWLELDRDYALGDLIQLREVGRLA